MTRWLISSLMALALVFGGASIESASAAPAGGKPAAGSVKGGKKGKKKGSKKGKKKGGKKKGGKKKPA